MEHLISDLNFTYWTWLIALVLFLGLEMTMPGIVFLWLALASGVVAGWTWIFPSVGWEWQVVTFSVLSVVSTFAGRHFVKVSGEIPSDNETLNRRTDTLIGRTVKVVVAIEDGKGKVRVGDSLWTAVGDDAPEGAKVTVIAASGTELHVKSAGT